MIFPLKPIFSKVIPFSDPNLSRSKSLISATTVPVRLSQPRCPHGSRPPSHLGRPQELEKSEGSGSNSQNCVHYKHIMISKLHIYIYICIYIYILCTMDYMYSNIIYLVCIHMYIYQCVYIYMTYIYIYIYIYMVPPPKKPMQTSILLVFTVNFIYFDTDFVPIKFEAPTVGKLKN